MPFQEIIKRREKLIVALIISLALMVRLAWVFLLTPFFYGALGGIVMESGGEAPPDFVYLYDPIAQNLVAGHGFSLVQGQPTAATAPGYPAFVAAMYAIGGRSVNIVRVGQILLDCVTLIIGYAIAKSAFRREVALAFSVLYGAVYPIFFYMTSVLAPEPLFTLLLALFVWSLMKMYNTETWFSALVCGICLGGASLCRPTAIPFAIIVIVVLIVSPNRTSGKKLLAAIVFSLGLGLTLGPWALRNYIHFKRFIPVQWYVGLPRITEEPANQTSDIVFVQRHLSELLSSPWKKIKRWTDVLFKLFFQTSVRHWDGKLRAQDVLLLMVQPPILVLGAWGWVHTLTRNRRSVPLLILVPFYIGLYVFIGLRLARYSIPVMPYIAMFASYALVGFLFPLGQNQNPLRGGVTIPGFGWVQRAD